MELIATSELPVVRKANAAKSHGTQHIRLQLRPFKSVGTREKKGFVILTKSFVKIEITKTFCYNKMFSFVNKTFGCCSKIFGCSNKKNICCP